MKIFTFKFNFVRGKKFVEKKNVLFLLKFFFFQKNEDFDNFFVFVPPWLAENHDEILKLLVILYGRAEISDSEKKNPAFVVFLLEKEFRKIVENRSMKKVPVEIDEKLVFSLNSTELMSSHLVIQRHDQSDAVKKIFEKLSDKSNVEFLQRVSRLASINDSFHKLTVR